MTQKSTILFVVIALFLISLDAKDVNLKNGKLYDSKNRELTLHGTNVVVKTPPYIPTIGEYNSVSSFGPEDIKNLKENGFNAIRLGVMWAGVEPNKNGFNETYLQEMVKIVNMAGQAGIYTLVEFHQDLLSQTFCGDGVPIWMVFELGLYKTFPFPLGPKMDISNFSCHFKSWSQYYFTYDVGRGFGKLYDKGHELNNRFMKYWEKVAQTFKGNPYVIAYELINEPWIGNIWRDPALIIPSMAQRLKLQQFYDQLSSVIRPIDPLTPLCFQPVTFDNFFPSGFSHTPGGNRYKNNSMLCYHYYQPPAINLRQLDTYVKDAKKLGIGSLLSETYGDPDTLDRAEYWKQSWMYWCYKDFSGNQQGMSDEEKVGMNEGKMPVLDHILTNDDKHFNMTETLVRTYLPRVAGQLESSHYNTTTKHFSATYWAYPKGQTVLFLSKDRIYNNFYLINVYPQNQVTITENGNYATLKYEGTQERKKILVSVQKI